MCSPEKVILNFSIKKTQKNDYYCIKVANEDPSLGDSSQFETEEIKCLEDGKEIIFKKKVAYNFYFDKRQKLIINIIKKIHVGNDYQIKQNERHTTLSSLVTSPDSTYERPLNKEFKNKDILSIKLTKENNTPKESSSSIFEFIKSGIKLSIFASLDYSNGNNKEPIENRNNNYLNILKVIISKIGIYTNNYSSFYFYGYGAQLKNSNNKSILYRSIFDIKMEEKDILELDRKFLEYYSNNSIPDKKICLSSLIRKITKEIYTLYKTNYYNALFILARELTDEKDKQETIDAIIESSYLPLTIIIIGEGKNDLDGMKNLFGKKIRKASNGMDKNRDNIIYINYKNDFDENPSRMIEFCLRIINEQIIHFYNLIKCTPLQIKINKVENLDKGFDQYHSSICLYESKIMSASQIRNVGYVGKVGNAGNVGKSNDKIGIDYDVDEIKDDDNYDSHKGKINEDQYKKNDHKKNYMSRMNPSVTIKKGSSKNLQKQDKQFKNDEENQTPGYVIPGDEDTIHPISKDNDNQNIQPINQYSNYKNNNNQGNGTNNNKKYFITPTGSVCKYGDDNPFKNDIEDKKQKVTPCPDDSKRVISPQESACPDIDYNPYNKKITPTPQPNEYIIPNQSVMQNENTTIVNPYSKDINNKNNKVDNTSGTSEFISTNNSNYNDSVKKSNIIRGNYSIDSSQMK
jgi:hypothetical protein